MNHRVVNHRKLLAGLGMCGLALAVIVTPTGRNMALGALAEFIEISERVAQLPCWMVNHTNCFSVDRFDPTCPQCM
jgi:hypothetical protein